ncbi:MAG: hypothetical protein UW70_C0005G0012 [Candidatus Peregrinibacteria bacterium GW2011_GWA2_44_7]|nr:MAG: hypothetical protein UW70_C0005G0012 [Candidatus Peregrinibacteria bacterium GW2011_GWA2_44_7]
MTKPIAAESKFPFRKIKIGGPAKLHFNWKMSHFFEI